MKKILLVDTTAFMHISWHGYDEKTGPDGQCHRVLKGVLDKLHKLNSQFEWDVMVNVVDPPEGSLFRKGLYPSYKANRPESDPDFTRQKNETREALGILGMNAVMIPGIESDDVLGTIAHREYEEGNSVIIVSPDKDLAQLVSGRAEDQKIIALVRPEKDEKGKSVFNIYQEEEVIVRYGVAPWQIADWLALIGDTSDNIRGVDKVGQKTAAKWLAKYKDLETIKANAADFTGVLGDNLRQALSGLDVTRQLTTIRRDFTSEIPRDMYINDNPCDTAAAQKLLAEKGLPEWLGFFSKPDAARPLREPEKMTPVVRDSTVTENVRPEEQPPAQSRFRPALRKPS